MLQEEVEMASCKTNEVVTRIVATQKDKGQHEVGQETRPEHEHV